MDMDIFGVRSLPTMPTSAVVKKENRFSKDILGLDLGEWGRGPNGTASQIWSYSPCGSDSRFRSVPEGVGDPLYN